MVGTNFLQYFCERIETLEILEDGYGPPIPINKLTIAKKALKQLSKNPALKQAFSYTSTFNAQLLNIVTGYGPYSFSVSSLRGLGEKEKGGQFILNWVGTHEEYNKEKSKR